MNPRTSRSQPRRRALLVLATVAVGFACVTTASLSFRADRPTDSETPAPPPATTSDLPTTQSPPAEAPPGLDTHTPEAFARRTAEAIFSWDTTGSLQPSGYLERLVTVADPSGESSAGLVADLRGYLPTPEAWEQLREYETKQWLKVTSLEIPDLWADATAAADPGKLLPGTTAYTVTGTRHRTGVWHGDTVTSSHDVAFTLFIVCGPTYPQCHLLRLSRLGEPLE